MRPRYVVRISPEDVGYRVSVRYRLPVVDRPDHEPGLTDVVGTLESWTDGRLSVRRRDGSLAEVAQDDLVAGRVVGR